VRVPVPVPVPVLTAVTIDMEIQMQVQVHRVSRLSCLVFLLTVATAIATHP
jgi:hypothetical protein